MRALSSCLLFCLFLNSYLPLFAESLANPFHLENVPEEVLSDEGCLRLQEELEKLSFEKDLKSIYPSSGSYSVCDDFLVRISAGIRARLFSDIPLADGTRTQRILKKIGNGGNRCVVTYATFNASYVKTAQRITEALEKTGFNGYFFAFLGGYPNPTGQEIQYAATPYAFKIFMMKEAEKLGFNHVLWIDGRCVPAKDLSPIFKLIEGKGSFFMGGIDASVDNRFILPYTRQVIHEMLNVDPLYTRKIGGGFIGLKMNSPLTKKFVETYYQLVRKGTPFISCFPEEFVISSILEYLGREKFVYSNDIKIFRKLLHCKKEVVEQDGYFFYHILAN